MYDIFQQVMSGASPDSVVEYVCYFGFVLIFVSSFFRLLRALFGR